jgi:hypothetical protein
MFRQRPTFSLVLGAVVVGLAVAIPLAANAATKPTKPVITKFSLTSAKPGEKFMIDGRRFTHVTQVKVDGLRALYKVDSAVKITATVPKHAKTGRVEVITKFGTAWSAHALKIV